MRRGATAKYFFPTGDVGWVDKYGYYSGIQGHLNHAADKDQCERMVVALTIGWKQHGTNDFRIVQSTIMLYAWTPSPDPTTGTCAPGKAALQAHFPTPDLSYGHLPTSFLAVDVYRVAISVGLTNVKSDFSNPNAGVGNADATWISHWLYNGQLIPEMAVLHRQDF